MGHLARQLPLTVPVYQVLLTLIDQTLHGYAIIRDIRERTGGEVDLTASTLYAVVARMLKAGFIVEVDDVDTAARGADGPRRRIYRITAEGRELVRLEAMRLERSAQMARDKDLLPTPPETDAEGGRP